MWEENGELVRGINVLKQLSAHIETDDNDNDNLLLITITIILRRLKNPHRIRLSEFELMKWYGK